MTKFVLCLSALLCVPQVFQAQQLATASNPGSLLPDAPSARSSAVVESAWDDPGQSSSSTPQTPTATPNASAGQTDPQSQAQDQTAAERKAEAERELKQEESQRMLGLMPAFNAVMNGKAVPLTPGQKFRLFFRGITDPFQFFIVGVDTGLEEAEDSYPEYHHGIPGLLRNYGAAYADDFDGNFFGNALLPSLLHQDPRYFRLGHGKPMHRLLYAMSTTVRAKGDNGKWQPNYSNIGGNFIGGAISNLYYPASDRGFALTIERGATVTAEGVVGALAIEFYPDFKAYLERRRQRKLDRQTPAAKTSGSGAHVYPSQP